MYLFTFWLPYLIPFLDRPAMEADRKAGDWIAPADLLPESVSWDGPWLRGSWRG